MEQQMMAMKVVQRTWHIAAAVLPIDVCTRAFADIKDSYVVINVPTRLALHDDGREVLALVSELVNPEVFENNYRFIDNESTGNFEPVDFQPRGNTPHYQPGIRYGSPGRYSPRRY